MKRPHVNLVPSADETIDGVARSVQSVDKSCVNVVDDYTGLPTVSFPVGLDADGMPLAIQLVGHPHGETELFRTAAWCEQVIRSQLL